MEEQKKGFLHDNFLYLTELATLARSKTYRQDIMVKPEDKGKFRCALRKRLKELAQQYTTEMDEVSHIENIKYLANGLSRDFAKVLENGEFRIGSAQKALNLYLKYLWCAGQICIPPHCPFDSRIIEVLSDCKGIKGINWTTLRDIKDYERLVEAARTKAGAIPIAQWELETYQRLASYETVIGK